MFFNRDELKDREPALPPRVIERDGITFLAPIDPRGGGTWIAANENGLVVALLNEYAADTVTGWPAHWGSRGTLVMDLAVSRTRSNVLAAMKKIRAADYPPFRLVAFSLDDAEAELHIDAWRGNGEGDIESIDPAMPMCSSSFETEAVIAERRRRFHDIACLSPESLWKFHHHGSPGPTSRSVRMLRADAQTWSISRISVSPGEIRFRYEAEALDLTTPAAQFESAIPRRGFAP